MCKWCAEQQWHLSHAANLEKLADKLEAAGHENDAMRRRLDARGSRQDAAAMGRFAEREHAK